MPDGLALAHLTQEGVQRLFADVPPAVDEPTLNRALPAHTGDVVGTEADFSCGLPRGNVRAAINDADAVGGGRIYEKCTALTRRRECCPQTRWTLGELRTRGTEDFFFQIAEALFVAA